MPTTASSTRRTSSSAAVPTQLAVTIHAGSTHSGTATALSSSAVFVETDAALELDQAVRIELTIADQPLNVTAGVRAIEANVVELEFVDLSRDSRLHLVSYVAGRRAELEVRQYLDDGVTPAAAPKSAADDSSTQVMSVDDVPALGAARAAAPPAETATAYDEDEEARMDAAFTEASGDLEPDPTTSVSSWVQKEEAEFDAEFDAVIDAPTPAPTATAPVATTTTSEPTQSSAGRAATSENDDDDAYTIDVDDDDSTPVASAAEQPLDAPFPSGDEAAVDTNHDSAHTAPDDEAFDSPLAPSGGGDRVAFPPTSVVDEAPGAVAAPADTTNDTPVFTTRPEEVDPVSATVAPASETGDTGTPVRASADDDDDATLIAPRPGLATAPTIDAGTREEVASEPTGDTPIETQPALIAAGGEVVESTEDAHDDATATVAIAAVSDGAIAVEEAPTADATMTPEPSATPVTEQFAEVPVPAADAQPVEFPERVEASREPPAFSSDETSATIAPDEPSETAAAVDEARAELPRFEDAAGTSHPGIDLDLEIKPNRSEPTVDVALARDDSLDESAEGATPTPRELDTPQFAEAVAANRSGKGWILAAVVAFVAIAAGVTYFDRIDPLLRPILGGDQPAVAIRTPIAPVTAPAPDASTTSAPAPPAPAPVATAPAAPREVMETSYAALPEVTALVAAGDQLFEAGKWSLPKGKSALDRYREALAIAPDNADAKRGVAAICDGYVRRASEVLADGDVSGARWRYQRVLEILASDVGATIPDRDPRRQAARAALAEL